VRRTVVSLALATVSACGNPSSDAPAKKTEEPPRKLAGVYPERFQCNSVATDAELTTTLGAAVKLMDSPSAITRGLAHPCTYEVETQPNPEYWTFDFDCRDNYKTTADALFKQYAEMSTAMVKSFNEQADAAPVPLTADEKKHERELAEDRRKNHEDAAIDAPQRAPEESSSVDIGAKALDHNGQGLLFIDDDAPCYVRIVGPDKAKRLALAQLLVKNLTFANAPMSPRPFK
jgi:hypothetical protein